MTPRQAARTSWLIPLGVLLLAALSKGHSGWLLTALAILLFLAGFAAAVFSRLELEARVIWCRAMAGGDHFVAGLQIVNGGAEASMLALSAIVQRLTA